MRFRQLFHLVALATILSLPASLVRADGSSESRTFRQIIQNQMQAFQRGDATSAFGLATRTLQKRYQSPDVFIEMVKRGYPPVYRPQSVTFGKIKDTDFGPVQEVYLIGPKGQNWLALYSFEQQDDGAWKISGCYLTKSSGLAA
ncbi:DUF4864 domain-containing protein [Roseibium sp.]|uniref:DUF4864 domain-containing protein n=1 Tax=Roseibium sp. TaxID=1936156 RepID=UPI003A9856BA